MIANLPPSQLRENLFEHGYAHTLLAFAGTVNAPGEAIGIAMYFFNFSTWTGKPGLYVSTLHGDHCVALSDAL